jgi:hypothetical protein
MKSQSQLPPSPWSVRCGRFHILPFRAASGAAVQQYFPAVRSSVYSVKLQPLVWVRRSRRIDERIAQLADRFHVVAQTVQGNIDSDAIFIPNVRNQCNANNSSKMASGRWLRSRSSSEGAVAAHTKPYGRGAMHVQFCPRERATSISSRTAVHRGRFHSLPIAANALRTQRKSRLSVHRRS